MLTQVLVFSVPVVRAVSVKREEAKKGREKLIKALIGFDKAPL